jgi:hypothetical protein
MTNSGLDSECCDRAHKGALWGGDGYCSFMVKVGSDVALKNPIKSDFLVSGSLYATKSSFGT